MRTQIASIVHVTTIQESNPHQSFAVRTTHRHPSAHKTEQKIYNVDVLFAEDDEDSDGCWTFEIMEGEDRLNRLLAYAQAFGKHGSGDDDYDEYVIAFQQKITGLVVRKMFKNKGYIMIKDGEDEVWFKPDGNGMDGNGFHGSGMGEDGRNK